MESKNTTIEKEIIRQIVREVMEELRNIQPFAAPPPKPAILTFKMAAVEMSQSVRKIQILLEKGIMSAVVIDGRRMIPMSEVERMATPKVAPLKSARLTAPRKQPKSVADEVAAAKESARRRRLR